MNENRGSILIADDEADILEIVSHQLRKAGYTVYEASDGKMALDLARQHKPELLILDVMMPYKTGIEVCRLLRLQPEFAQTPIMMLTALNDEASHVKGLDIGADDFVSKPVAPKILLSRINALIRRTYAAAEPTRIIEAGEMIIDPERFLVKIHGEEKTLAKKEFELLYLLASRPGKVFLRNEILSAVWGNEVIVGDRTIDVHIRKIRQKLNVDCITTVKGVGYKFYDSFS